MHLARRIAAEPADVDRPIGWPSYRGRRNRGRGRHRRGRRSTFRKFWGWAIERGHTEVNAADAPARVKAGVANPRPCPDNAYKAALMAARPRERLMLRLSAEMGLRRAEVSCIHARDAGTI